MGLKFGNLAKIYGVTYFRLSPHEQRAFAGMLTHGLPNNIRHLRPLVFRCFPIMLYTYVVIQWGKEEFHKLSRKNPALYENDV